LDPAHCGACDVSCPATTPVCSGFESPPGNFAIQCGCDDASCSGGTICCANSGTCADLSSDVNHCGYCFNACNGPIFGATGDPVCLDGACYTTCDSGLCDSHSACCNGQCVRTETNPYNCGVCGNVCPDPGPGGVAACQGYSCIPE